MQIPYIQTLLAYFIEIIALETEPNTDQANSTDWLPPTYVLTTITFASLLYSAYHGYKLASASLSAMEQHNEVQAKFIELINSDCFYERPCYTKARLEPFRPERKLYTATIQLANRRISIRKNSFVDITAEHSFYIYRKSLTKAKLENFTANKLSASIIFKGTIETLSKTFGDKNKIRLFKTIRTNEFNKNKNKAIDQLLPRIANKTKPNAIPLKISLIKANSDLLTTNTSTNESEILKKLVQLFFALQEKRENLNPRKYFQKINSINISQQRLFLFIGTIYSNFKRELTFDAETKQGLSVFENNIVSKENTEWFINGLSLDVGSNHNTIMRDLKNKFGVNKTKKLDELLSITNQKMKIFAKHTKAPIEIKRIFGKASKRTKNPTEIENITASSSTTSMEPSSPETSTLKPRSKKQLKRIHRHIKRGAEPKQNKALSPPKIRPTPSSSKRDNGSRKYRESTSEKLFLSDVINLSALFKKPNPQSIQGHMLSISNIYKNQHTAPAIKVSALTYNILRICVLQAKEAGNKGTWNIWRNQLLHENLLENRPTADIMAIAKSISSTSDLKKINKDYLEKILNSTPLFSGKRSPSTHSNLALTINQSIILIKKSLTAINAAYPFAQKEKLKRFNSTDIDQGLFHAEQLDAVLMHIIQIGIYRQSTPVFFTQPLSNTVFNFLKWCQSARNSCAHEVRPVNLKNKNPVEEHKPIKRSEVQCFILESLMDVSNHIKKITPTTAPSCYSECSEGSPEIHLGDPSLRSG